MPVSVSGHAGVHAAVGTNASGHAGAHPATPVAARSTPQVPSQAMLGLQRRHAADRVPQQLQQLEHQLRQLEQQVRLEQQLRREQQQAAPAALQQAAREALEQAIEQAHAEAQLQAEQEAMPEAQPHAPQEAARQTQEQLVRAAPQSQQEGLDSAGRLLGDRSGPMQEDSEEQEVREDQQGDANLLQEREVGMQAENVPSVPLQQVSGNPVITGSGVPGVSRFKILCVLLDRECILQDFKAFLHHAS